MEWLRYVEALWPIFLALAIVGSTGVVYWLRIHFPSRRESSEADLRLEFDFKASITDLICKMDTMTDRLEAGSRRMNDHASRLDVLERLESHEPTRAEMLRRLDSQGQRISSVESKVDGVANMQATANGYLEKLHRGRPEWSA